MDNDGRQMIQGNDMVEIRDQRYVEELFECRAWNFFLYAIRTPPCYEQIRGVELYR